MSDNIGALRKKSCEIRRKILNMCVKAGTGHVTSSFSCVEILVALYHGKILNYSPANPKFEERDRFVLSKGQASPILYVVLANLGFFTEKWLDRFCCADGKFGVHLQHDIPGVEITSGSLGQGFGVGAGMALAAKMDKKNHMVFALLGDGECYEGSVWETAMFAGHYKLDNLVAIIDRNGLCVMDFTEKIVSLDPLAKKWESFGWEAITINGHLFEEILPVLKDVRRRPGKSKKPLVIIANTVKGKGVSFMENKPLWHGIAPKGEEAESAMRELLTDEGEPLK